MNGITKPLPGLLDDPQFQITDLPALTDFQIAPLRNPAPTRHANIPLPLEPLASNILNNSRNTKKNTQPEDHGEKRRAPKITPNDVLLARESKKPHLAISELLEANDGPEIAPTHLPSFISLSVVEKSPIQAPTELDEQHHSQKRIRLDTENDHIALDLIRRLPRPAQKDERQTRPAPLLPAMVTGLHEPPPSAALLPSIDVDSRPNVSRTTTTSKIHVKDILTQSDENGSPPPPARQVTLTGKDVANVKQSLGSHATRSQEVSPVATEPPQPVGTWKDNKPRRARRKWSEDETKDLLAGVKKYGVGKWKQILDDPSFSFSERSSVDLKDRYRVCANNDSVPKLDTAPAKVVPNTDPTTVAEARGNSPDTASPDKATASISPIDQGQAPKQRRKRRAWTALEDENLLKGVAKHGFQWTAIHDDVELDLKHRRATDLRDRIRNRFPDGYKHAETAPLRSEVKKAEKLGVSSRATATSAIENASTPTRNSATPSIPQNTPTPPQTDRSTPTPTRVVNGPIKPPLTSASMTMLIHSVGKDGENTREKDKADKDKDRDRERGLEKPGVKLPSLTLDVDDDMDWEDNRLPPLHEWDEIGLKIE
ncbi:uncharacterized protein Z518_04485 [Rhinocladiella mackenziei CBS 650.93]|uniref:Myb-like domain-containing protein n=1 Tax=Rhinocladiella mackenziei CBS 650.93 TaxID=1442369 RepID=A0A0D2ILD8_9EURO|nr:uncharacterized protein Z518_04485 [Rhinocladiella mackenziei CBS 650.93]KIX06509.1 hypothetical protein Z518_04485 [Rhinocladiella mackenziei CBS 650.93]